MKEYPNFYEDLAEATKRLTGTVVKYDDEFYYVMLISNHKTDGIFRAYLDPVNVMESHTTPGMPFLGSGSASGEAMDSWMQGRDTKILRKMLNSPLFDKFRPFPLGMANVDGFTVFTERSPTRHTQQGLTSQMISGQRIGLMGPDRWGVEATNRFMYDVYKGVYPTYSESYENMTDPHCRNKSVGFSRTMALIRGPVDTLFLNYRGETVGIIEGKDGKTVRLAKKFKFTKEIIEESGFFDKVVAE
jgi:hypothetical protein